MSAAVVTSAGFSSNFINRLEESQRRLDEFVSSNKSKADAIIDNLHQVQNDEQQKIDSLLHQLKSLQYERGVAAAANNNAKQGKNSGGGLAEQRKQLENKEQTLKDEVMMLQKKNRVEQEQLDEVMAEEAAIRRKANEVRAKKEEIEMARGITVEDLTKGLLNYKFTGLTFEQGEKGALRFKFSKLDKDDPSRPFIFTLSTGDNEEYQLSGVNPSLDEEKTNAVLDVLNKDGKSGFNSFAVGMRKLFKETLQ